MGKKISGMPGRIKVEEDQFGNLIIDIDPTYGGQVSINTTGTLNVSRYAGEVIPPTSGGTGCANQGVISVQGDTTITGSLTLECDPNTQTVLTITGSGTVALQEDNLKTSNCFSEFSDEQAITAFDEIAPTFEKGQLIVYNGKQNAAVNPGQINQFLGVGFKTGLPEYQYLPNIYSYIANDPFNEQKISYLPLRNILNFASRVFRLQDCSKTKRTVINFDPRIEEFAKQEKGLFVNCANDVGTKYFAKRVLQEGSNIKISNKDFINADPVIGLSEEYKGQNSIKILGNIQEGQWLAKIIEPKHGGTGVDNQHKIQIRGDVKLEVPFIIRNDADGFEDGGLTVAIEGKSFVKIPSFGTLATTERSLQSANNLKDLYCTKEAFRHISPTKQKGDIIIRGERDYDECLQTPKQSDHFLVSDSDSDIGVSYKRPEEIHSLVSLIEINFEKKKLKMDEDYQKLLKKYEMYESVVGKRIDAICAQFDTLMKNKQQNIIKDLQNELKIWSAEKTKLQK
jgi:hypothetical protein